MDGIYEESAAKNSLKGAKAFKLLMIALSLLGWLAVLITCFMAFGSQSSFVYFIVLFVMLAVAVVPLCLQNRYFVEYDFAFYGTELTVAKIINNSRRKELLTLDIKHIEMLVEADEARSAELGKNTDRRIRAVANPEAALTCILFTDNKERRTILTAEISEKLFHSLAQRSMARVIRK